MPTCLYVSVLFRSFFLKIGITDTVFASSENESFRRSLSVIFVRCESIILADSLTIFGGTLSGPVDFFAFASFIILFMCSEVAAAGLSNVFLTVFLLLIFKILGYVWYFRIIDCAVAMSLVLFSELPSISGEQPEVFCTMLP